MYKGGELGIVLNKYQTQALARAGDFELWPIIKDVLEKELDMVRKDVRNNPRMCDDDLTEDIRHKLGEISRLEWVLEIPARARKELSGGRDV
jgi:hypothetical protein